MRVQRHSEDVASEPYTARVDDANGTIAREKKHLTQICVHKIGGSTLVPCGYVKASLENKPSNTQITFEPKDIQAAIKKALNEGATLIAEAEVKPWGWESAMIRDPEGNLIELARRIIS